MFKYYTAKTASTTPESIPVPAQEVTAAPGLKPAPQCTTGYSCLRSMDFGTQDSTRYNIDLSLEVASLSNTQAYTSARNKWMDMIVGDLPSVPRRNVNAPDWCTLNGYPASIDDVHICGKDESIDGRGGVLGRARPLWGRRNVATGKWTTVAGEMGFDIPGKSYVSW